MSGLKRKSNWLGAIHKSRTLKIGTFWHLLDPLYAFYVRITRTHTPRALYGCPYRYFIQIMLKVIKTSRRVLNYVKKRHIISKNINVSHYSKQILVEHQLRHAPIPYNMFFGNDQPKSQKVDLIVILIAKPSCQTKPLDMSRKNAHTSFGGLASKDKKSWWHMYRSWLTV